MKPQDSPQNLPARPRTAADGVTTEGGNTMGWIKNDADETAKMDERDEQIMKVAHGIDLKDLKSGGTGKGK